MTLLSRSHRLCLAIVVAGTASCGSDDGGSAATPTSSTTSELDVIGLAERPASLLVLSPGATSAQRRRLEQTLVRLGGSVLETLPPRLVIAQVPTGAEAALAALGVVGQLDRAVTAADLAAATLPEERFLAVHAARWYPSEVPPRERLAPRFVRRPPGAMEGPPQAMPQAAREAALAAEIDPEDLMSVPFASGTVVVSVVLPESNGTIDPSTEDWNEDLVRETYLKVQAALDKIAAAEPNADLRFILHYESAPAAGGLPGTVDTGLEFGQRAQWASATEPGAIADLLTRILGHEVLEQDVWSGSLEYTAKLKRQYDADAAFFVMVAANSNGTAGLRAHANFNGPWTVLETYNHTDTFMHEFGHIFGAFDEYCPDACTPPTLLGGYLGMINANAFSNESGGGIDKGRGESVSSLMEANNPDAINGYTRGAWGWLDTDGDGIIEVRDTLPRSELIAAVTGQRVRLTGQIVDRGDSRQFWGTRLSANRIVALEYGFAATGPWFRVGLPGTTRGRQAVDLELTGVRAGTRPLFVRGLNSVGNVEARPLALTVTTTGATNTAPHLRLDTPARAGTAAPVTVTTTALDLDGDAVQVRYDLDGNGSWDTGYRAPGAYPFTPAAGVVTVRAQARDARGATRITTAELPVVRGDAAPFLALTDVPSLIHGVATGEVALTATATDPEGQTIPLNVITELLTTDAPYRQKGPISADGRLTVALPTPASLRTRLLDLTAGDPTLWNGWIRDLVALDANHLVVAAGPRGLWVVDITDRAAPRVRSQLALETTANRLYRAGNRLYVLGTYLTVVDLSDLDAPRELKQVLTATAQPAAEVTEPVAVPDGSAAPQSHDLYFNHGAKVTATRVTVTVEHPRPADLKIQLVAAKDLRLAPVVLWDHGAGPGGLRTWTFTAATTPALRTLVGVFPEGGWRVEIIDDQANGQAGQLVASRVQFDTSARAARVLDGAVEIAGVTSSGHLAIAGHGIEVLNVAVPQLIRSLSRLTGTGTQHATLVGNTMVITSHLQTKDPVPPRLRGLCAINVDNGRAPQVVRCDTALGGETFEHAQVGSRLYVQLFPTCETEGCNPDPITIVGDAARFARNLSWKLGTSALRLDRAAVGDDQKVWTIGSGHVQELDVSNPAQLAVLRDYPRSTTNRLVPLRLPEVVMFDFSNIAKIATLGEAEHILSRIYRITVEARDPAGTVTRASRTVHVIPYDHAPDAVRATIIPGWAAGGPALLKIEVTDPDRGQPWDPSVMARVDWDADGSFDTDWNWLGQDGAGGYSTIIDMNMPAGTYHPVVEARDGFWGRLRVTPTLVIP